MGEGSKSKLVLEISKSDFYVIFHCHHWKIPFLPLLFIAKSNLKIKNINKKRLKI